MIFAGDFDEMTWKEGKRAMQEPTPAKTYPKLYQYVDAVCAQLKDAQVQASFRKCYLNTLETTLTRPAKDDTYVITGDIPAMWLRDSSVQVSHYVRLAGQDAQVDAMVRGLLNRQWRYILADPYANAFNQTANGHGHREDDTLQNDLVWERKYELDSLIYPLWLLLQHFAARQDVAVFDNLFLAALKQIINTLRCEQDYHKHSPYYFTRAGEDAADSLDNGGRGGAYRYTGMIRSAFRPSDDRCEYSFHVPSNMFALSTLRKLTTVLQQAGVSFSEMETIETLCDEIETGIQTYAIQETSEFGAVYAYEVDGLGNALLMDDANVPSLLSLPYLGFCPKDDPRYLNTRRFILSKKNPYYYTGKAACGIGSPHTPSNYIWHIALIMQALTTDDVATQQRIFQILQDTTADTGFMHESFDCNDAERYTRPWFAWANTLYAIFIMDCIVK